TLTFVANGGGYVNVTRSVTVTIYDDDVDRIVLSAPAEGHRLREGGAAARHGVRLSRAPSADVTVSVRSGDAGAVSVDTDLTREGAQGAMTFTPQNWNVEQTLSALPLQDADTDDEDVSVYLTASGEFSGVTRTLALLVEDDDGARPGPDDFKLLVTRVNGNNRVIEGGGNIEYKVQLSHPPVGGAVTLRASVSDPGAVTVDTQTGARAGGDQHTWFVREPPSIASTEWRHRWTAYVTAVQDADSKNEYGTIHFTAAGGGYDGVTASDTFEVIDRPSPDFTITQDTPFVETPPVNGVNSKIGQFSVVLTSKPPNQHGDVQFTVTSRDLSRASSGSLQMPPSKWHEKGRHTVDITGPVDSDQDHDEVTFTFTANGNGYRNLSKDITVRVYDTVSSAGRRGALLVRPSDASLVLREGGTRVPYGVRLASRPTQPVTVTAVSADPTSVTLDGDIYTAGNQSQMTFTAANWDTLQTLAVLAVPDADADDEQVRLTLTSASTDAGYDGLITYQTVEVIDDNDAPVGLDFGLELDAHPLEGEPVGFFLYLDEFPSGIVNLSIHSSDPDRLLPNNESEGRNQIGASTFTPGTRISRSTPTKVDADTEDNTVKMTVTLNGGGFNNVSKSLDVTIIDIGDDDKSPLSILPLNAAALNGMVEGGEPAKYSFRLIRAPTITNDYATVKFTASNASAVTLDAQELTQGNQSTTRWRPDGNNWKRAGLVTVWGNPDVDTDDETGSITVTGVSGGFDNFTAATDSADFKVIDSGAPDFTVTRSTAFVETPPDGSSNATIGRFAVTLSRKPPLANENVTFTITSGDAARADSATLSIAPGDWNKATNTVDITGALDSDQADDDVTFTFTANGNGYSSVSKQVKVTIKDSGTANSIVVSRLGDAGAVHEGGAAAEYSVRLSAAPTANVTVTVASSDIGAVTVDTDPVASGNQPTLSFTAANWKTAQSFTASPVDDADYSDESVTISLSASGGGYGAATASETLRVDDDESPPALDFSISGSASGLEGAGGGGGIGGIGVTLEDQPSSLVTITVTSSAPAKLDFASGSTVQASHTFTRSTGNWQTRTPLATMYTSEDSDTADDYITLTFVASGGGYLDVTKTQIITVYDLGANRIVLPSASAIERLTEGDAASSYGVRLSRAPSGNVTVTVSSSDAGALAVDTDPSTAGNQGALTFTPTSWSAEQSVRLLAVQDVDANDESVTVNLAGSGDYAGVTNVLTVNITDDDKPVTGRGLSAIADVSGTEGGAAVARAL
ncbi:MAG: hypothetical protein ISN29_08550, partial [Gammaproteobacteria bacterium AqS3]|nr:hypothetical protein [Gammaproteobacteria bacterium AqS3]